MTAAPASPRPSSVSRDLGILGWEHLDPLLLAALALEAPLLLVGDHGTGKTLLVERLAAALGHEFRHYNASLLNYDDLVGIPLPTETGDLRFVGTAGAVWGASFVFFDEVNRCRPDLQNKLFPIVHERRIAGTDLADLRHRWAAMNPPAEHAGANGYLGVEDLDTALADRFWFVVSTPTWANLSREDKLALVQSPPVSHGVDLLALVAAARTEYALLESAYGETVSNYVVSFVDLLRKDLQLSARRGAILYKTILMTAAAASVLAAGLDLKSSTELAVLNGMPSTASASPVPVSTVIAAHSQAWAVSGSKSEKHLRRIFEEQDPFERLVLGLELGVDEDMLGSLAIAAVSGQASKAEKMGLAAVMVYGFADRPFTPAAWSALTDVSRPVFTPGDFRAQIHAGPGLDGLRRVAALVVDRRRTSDFTKFEEAYLAACDASMLAACPLSPEALLDRVRHYASRLGMSS